MPGDALFAVAPFLSQARDGRCLVAKGTAVGILGFRGAGVKQEAVAGVIGKVQMGCSWYLRESRLVDMLPCFLGVTRDQVPYVLQSDVRRARSGPELRLAIPWLLTRRRKVGGST